MKDYIYDGTFDGMLTCIYHHYYTDRAAGICTEDRYRMSFLQEAMTVETDPEKADRVYEAIRKKISDYDLRCVYRAWLSCDAEKEMKILRYLILGFRKGYPIASLYGEPVVNDLQKILKKIYAESERMLQFVRFSVMEGDVLYAEVEPDNDVIELAARHFCDRFRSESFIIHDVGRDKAIVASGGRWIISAFTPDRVPACSDDEKACRRLWKEYFDHIAIMERKNARCQNNFVPLRYRKHLTEFTEI